MFVDARRMELARRLEEEGSAPVSGVDDSTVTLALTAGLVGTVFLLMGLLYFYASSYMQSQEKPNAIREVDEKPEETVVPPVAYHKPPWVPPVPPTQHQIVYTQPALTSPPPKPAVTNTTPSSREAAIRAAAKRRAQAATMM